MIPLFLKEETYFDTKCTPLVLFVKRCTPLNLNTLRNESPRKIGICLSLNFRTDSKHIREIENILF